MYDSVRFPGNQVNGWLVVLEVNDRPINSLPRILCLFESEHVLVEVELKCFIGIVDAQLLEGIYLEVLLMHKMVNDEIHCQVQNETLFDE